jgi:hypothetical protein
MSVFDPTALAGAALDVLERLHVFGPMLLGGLVALGLRVWAAARYQSRLHRNGEGRRFDGREIVFGRLIQQSNPATAQGVVGQARASGARDSRVEVQLHEALRLERPHAAPLEFPVGSIIVIDLGPDVLRTLKMSPLATASMPLARDYWALLPAVSGGSRTGHVAHATLIPYEPVPEVSVAHPLVALVFATLFTLWRVCSYGSLTPLVLACVATAIAVTSIPASISALSRRD